MTILATTGDVKTRSSEDAIGILEIFFFLFGVKKDILWNQTGSFCVAISWLSLAFYLGQFQNAQRAKL